MPASVLLALPLDAARRGYAGTGGSWEGGVATPLPALLLLAAEVEQAPAPSQASPEGFQLHPEVIDAVSGESPALNLSRCFLSGGDGSSSPVQDAATGL